VPFARTALLLIVATVVVGVGTLSAQVRLEVGADGKAVMTNSGSRPAALRARSTAPPRTRSAPTDVEALIVESSRNLGLDADLIRAVIQVESGFNPNARSHKGAMGLMQLMPQTAATLAVSDPWDPRQNIRGGSAYLQQMLDRFGQMELALAGYNAGPEAVRRYGGVPPYRETENYVEKVLRIYRDDPGYRLPASVAPRAPRRSGKKTYLYRDPNGSLVMTTEPP
jgi:soluble lytic murein transglycosylase-like protein